MKKKTMIIGAVLILGAFVVFASGESEKKDNNGNATSNATTSTQKPAQEEVTYEDVNATDLMISPSTSRSIMVEQVPLVLYCINNASYLYNTSLRETPFIKEVPLHNNPEY